MLGPSVQTILTVGGIFAPYVREGQVWRLFWAPFLHAGLFHLLGNAIVWISLGKLLEPDWGCLRFTSIFVVAAVSGSLLSVIMNTRDVSVGSSGGIYGVLGATCIYVLEYWHSIPVPKFAMLGAFITILFAIGTSFLPLVDVYAHMGGLVGGILMALCTMKRFGWKDQFIPAVEQPRSQQRRLRSAEDDNSDLINQDSLTSVVGFEHAGNQIVADPYGCSVPENILLKTDCTRLGFVRGNTTTHFNYPPAPGNGVVVNAKAHRTTFRRTFAVDGQIEEAKPGRTTGVIIVRCLSALTLALAWGTLIWVLIPVA